MKLYLIITCIIYSLTAYSQIDEDLRLYYKFDNDMLDHSQSMIHGTELGGVVVYDEGFEAECINLTEDGEHVFIDTSFQLSLPFSISTWVKPAVTDKAWQTIIGKYQVSFYGSFWFGLHFDKVNMWLPVGNGQEVYYDSQTSISPDEWTHIVWVGNSNNEGKMYINGELDLQMGYIPDIFQNSDSLLIGRQSLFLANTDDYANYNGSVDELRVYGKELTENDVNELYKGVSSLDVTKLDEIQLFPNPAFDHFIVNGLTEDEVVLDVYSSTGVHIINKTLSKGNNLITTIDWDSGIYYCRILRDNVIRNLKVQIVH